MDDDQADLVSRLFALLTAQLEDGATLAMEGQGRQTLPDQHERAQALEAQVRDAHTLAQAVVMLTRPSRVGAEEGAPALGYLLARHAGVLIED